MILTYFLYETNGHETAKLFLALYAITCLLSTGLFCLAYYKVLKEINHEMGKMDKKDHENMVKMSKIHFIGIIILIGIQLIFTILVLSFEYQRAYIIYHHHYGYILTVSAAIYNGVSLLIGFLITIVWIIWNFYFKSWLSGIYQARTRKFSKEYFHSLTIMMMVGAFTSLFSLICNSLVYFASIILIAIIIRRENTIKKKQGIEISRSEISSSEDGIFCFNCGKKISNKSAEKCPHCETKF